MINWFTCKIRCEKTLENGLIKKVTECYLVDALSFTEAEARIIEEVAPFYSEFEVAGVAKANYQELSYADDCEAANIWFKAKISFITLDEKSGNEKKTFAHLLIQAQDLRDAIHRLDEGMKGTMADYIICSVAETPIVDVYKFKND